MTKRTVQGLAWMLMAAPLVLVGCSDSGDKNGGTGGAGGIKYDGGGGAGGSTPDGGPVTDTKPAQVDSQPAIDTVVADAPVQPDAPAILDGGPVLDVSLVDTKPPAVDAPPVIDTPTAIDATPAIDTTPVVAVCTETTKWTGGTVNADRTLSKACSPYTIKTDIDVNGNATLTIEPGVTLRFDPEKEISIGYSAAAKLLAVGTAAEPIVFTSSASTPGAGDWVGMKLWSNTMNGTALKYVKFDYCGSNADACLLGTGAKPNRVTVDHVTFSHVGPGSNAIWQKDKDSNFTISSCTFSDIPTTPKQSYAISVYAPSFVGIDSTNVFNDGAQVELMGGVVAANSTWKNIGTTVAVTNDLSIEGTATPVLTLAAGSVFKFASGIELSVGYGDPGSLTIAGTAAAPVTLTSLAGTPAAGDWLGVRLWYNATATIKYANISYAGSDKGAIDVVSNTVKLDIQNSAISSSASYGIRIPCNSTATVVNTNNTFTACESGDVGPGPAGTDCH